MIWKITERK